MSGRLGISGAFPVSIISAYDIIPNSAKHGMETIRKIFSLSRGQDGNWEIGLKCHLTVDTANTAIAYVTQNFREHKPWASQGHSVYQILEPGWIND